MQRTFRLFVVLMAFASTAFADGWTAPETPGYIQVSGQNPDGSRVYVIVSPAVNTACTAANATTQLRLDASTQRGKYEMSLVSMAFGLGKKFTASLASCDDWGFPIIYD